MPKKKPKSATPPKSSTVVANHNVVTSANDNLSKALKDLVPPKYRGTDQFLDVVQWNVSAR